MDWSNPGSTNTFQPLKVARRARSLSRGQPSIFASTVLFVRQVISGELAKREEPCASRVSAMSVSEQRIPLNIVVTYSRLNTAASERFRGIRSYPTEVFLRPFA